MPRPKRTKVAPSAPTAVPFLQKVAAEAQKASVASAGEGNTAVTTQKGTFDDLYDVSDKENERPERVPSSMPEEQSTATGITMLKVRSTPQTLQRKGSQHSAMHRRVQATPGRDSSMLSLGDFKRRSRQPSLLGIGRADDTPELSSLGDGLSAELDDLADFQPVDESTPLHARHTQPRARLMEATTPAATREAGRKSKAIPDVHIPESQRRSESGDDEDILEDLTIPATATNRDEPDLPTPKCRAVTPPTDSTMAPPQSPTSSERPEHVSAFERPTRARLARSQAKKAPSTAALQHLLPKRRGHKRANFHIASDATIPSSPTLPEEDDDEISLAPTRKASKGKRAASATQSQALQPAKQGTTRTTPAARSESEAPTGRRVTRTYGRRSQGEEVANDSLVAAEDEDELEESTDSIEMPRAAQAELERVSAKFKAIDDWEMDFENVSGSLESDSPGDAR